MLSRIRCFSHAVNLHIYRADIASRAPTLQHCKDSDVSFGILEGSARQSGHFAITFGTIIHMVQSVAKFVFVSLQSHPKTFNPRLIHDRIRIIYHGVDSFTDPS